MTDIRIGSINGSHGIKGWIKVFSYTDPAEAIFDYSPWFIERGGERRQITIEEGQKSGKRLIARLENVEDRAQADALIGYDIYIQQERLPDLEEGGYYWFQLEGLTVRSASGDVLGEIDHLLETGANDVMVVRPTSGSIDENERLIPYVEDEVIIKVDRSAGEVIVDWEADY